MKKIRKKISPPGSSATARSRPSRFFRDAGSNSIRFATLLGGLLAFVLLCMLSVRAYAAPLVSDPRPAAAPAVSDALDRVGQSFHDTHPHDQTDASASLALAGGEGRDTVSQPAADARAASIEWQTWLLVVAALAIVALGNACLFRGVLSRSAETLRRTEEEWTRRCDAAEAGERAVRAAASAEASAAATRERLRVLAAMRIYAEAPLIAVTGMLESIKTAAMLATDRTQLAVAESAMRTWSQTLRDLLDVAPVQSRGIVLDESVTNLRDLIDGVVALLSMNAARRGTCVVVTVDPTVATRILADGARLGQMIFHLLSRAIQLGAHQAITVVVRSEPLNPGSQRISVSLTGTDSGDPPAAQLQFFELGADEPSAGAWPVDTDVGMALCETIAQRMQGELSLSSGSDCGIYASFSAPFPVEQWGLSSEPARHAQAPSAIAAQAQDASLGVPSEPFERRYLDVLAEEGIDLPAFLSGWRHSMDDDLARLSGLSRQRDSEGLRSMLHRLSGAVGLVGAHSLMEALRRASVAPLEFDVGAIDTLVERARTLATQLDTAFDPHRSLIQ